MSGGDKTGRPGLIRHNSGATSGPTFQLPFPLEPPVHSRAASRRTKTGTENAAGLAAGVAPVGAWRMALDRGSTFRAAPIYGNHPHAKRGRHAAAAVVSNWNGLA